MNVIREIQKLNDQELELGLSMEASWHHAYRDSAYVFISGLDPRLKEEDIITIFSQFGEVEDINLVKDKETKKSKGFCFLKYEDQRSTILAVDNLNGASVADRLLRVDHVRDYRQPKRDEEVEEIAEDHLVDKRSIDNDNKREQNRSPHREEDLRVEYREEPQPVELSEEALKNQLARELGIADDDPMREYLVDQALENRRKREKKEKKHKHKKRHHREHGHRSTERHS